MTSPENTVLITDIGTLPPQQLSCTSDRMPCCRDPPRYGERKFPNGNQVSHISEGAVAFHRNRDNNGSVNLFRVSNDVLSLTGRFCCEMEDATSTNHTLCVNIGEYLTKRLDFVFNLFWNSVASLAFRSTINNHELLIVL